ncbi:MAG: flagellar biosynthetic protein FliQ [Acidobacteriota bacterium]
MTADTILGLVQEMLWLTLKLATPPLLAGLLVGLTVSIVQTATSVQDATLTQVPKMAATLVAIYLAFTWGIDALVDFVVRVMGLVAAGV